MALPGEIVSFGRGRIDIPDTRDADQVSLTPRRTVRGS
jgi:hypothetical protein